MRPQAARSASMLATEPEQDLAIDRLYRRQPATAMVFILQPELAAFKFQQPAVAISAMDLLLDVGNNVWRAVADLAMYSLIALALYLLFVAIRWPLVRWWKGRAGEVADGESEPTLREMLEQDDYAAAHYDPRRDQGGRLEPRL